MPEQKVLILCDNPVNSQAWALTLRHNQVQPLETCTLQEALRIWAAEIPDLILIDLLNPESDPVLCCQDLRAESAIPILIFANHGDEDFMLRAYLAGADECTWRPVSPAVCLAKVTAWLRHSRSVPAEELTMIQVGALRLEPASRELATVDGNRVRLTNLELRLLLLLMSHPGKCFSFSEIIQRVWGYKEASQVAESSNHILLKNVIYRLRRKIEPEPNQPRYILTESGVGYSFSLC